MSNTSNHCEATASSSAAQVARRRRHFRRDPAIHPDIPVLQATRDLKLAYDMAEFDGIPYPNLDLHDTQVYLLAYIVLTDIDGLNSHGRPFRHRRSCGDRRSRARTTLRALKQVSEGTRPKFETIGAFIKPGQL